MALREFNVGNYYEVDEKITGDEFLDILEDMNEIGKEQGYTSYCVTDTLEKIYGADDCEIAFVTKEYATPINNGPNCSLREYKIFGLTIDGEDLLDSFEEMRGHGRTPLDIVANFALLSNEATELEIVKEAMILYEHRRNKKAQRSKNRILKLYSPKNTKRK